MTDDNVLCHFYSSANTNGCLLLGEKCTGTRSKRVCKFRKTTREYIEANNRAIELNREKGNCMKCKYRSLKCEPVEIKEEKR